MLLITANKKRFSAKQDNAKAVSITQEKMMEIIKNESEFEVCEKFNNLLTDKFYAEIKAEGFRFDRKVRRGVSGTNLRYNSVFAK